MSADAILGLIGGALIALLSWISIMLFGIRERVVVIETRDTAEKAARAKEETLRTESLQSEKQARSEAWQSIAEILRELRADRHWLTNWVPAAEGIIDSLDGRVAAIDKQPRERGAPWPLREKYHQMLGARER